MAPGSSAAHAASAARCGSLRAHQRPRPRPPTRAAGVRASSTAGRWPPASGRTARIDAAPAYKSEASVAGGSGGRLRLKDACRRLRLPQASVADARRRPSRLRGLARLRRAAAACSGRRQSSSDGSTCAGTVRRTYATPEAATRIAYVRGSCASEGSGCASRTYSTPGVRHVYRVLRTARRPCGVRVL